MNVVEFITELSGSRTLIVPVDVADQLPRSGRVRVLLLTETDEAAALDAAYEQAYLRLPEDVSSVTSLLPHLAIDGEDWT